MSEIMGALKHLIVDDEGRLRVNGMAPYVAEAAPKKLRPKHRYVIMLHEMGYKSTEIAHMVGYSEWRVSIILNWRGPEIDEYRQAARQKLDDRAATVADRITDAAHEMLDVMLVHARDTKTNPVNSRLAARDLLHMAGYSPVKKTVSAHFDQRTPPELTDAIAQLDKLREVQIKEDQWRVQTPQLKDGTNG